VQVGTTTLVTFVTITLGIVHFTVYSIFVVVVVTGLGVIYFVGVIVTEGAVTVMAGRVIVSISVTV
jgi:hypothetical protein